MDGALRELDLREESLRGQLAARCAELHEQRVRAASALEKAISGKLRRLGFAKSAFQVAMTPCEPGPSGSDIAEYRFSPNVGEDLKPLRQIASSGEVARVMLAVKAVLSEADNVPVLIFDEIDANVGGRVAVSVAEELRAVAEGHQVFSITHLPQIAASGSSHFLVSKHVEDGRTCTDMVRLEGKKRLEEIVRMLGAEAGSATALAHARELLRGFAK